MRTTVFTLFVAGVAVSLCAAQASAGEKSRRHHHAVPHYVENTNEAPPLTVNKRSWLDPGPAVPVGHDNNYVTANTVQVKTPDQVYNTAQFGNGTLMETPYVGHAAPLVEFGTGPHIGEVQSGPTLDLIH